MAGPPWAQATSTQLEAVSSRAGSALRVPGLTVLWHPVVARVGERALLPGLGDGRSYAVARGEPAFAQPGASAPTPLADRGLSRAPLSVRGDGGGVVLERGECRMAVEVDGEALGERLALSPEALTRGVVLLLGGRVALALSWVEPLTDVGEPRFGIVGESPAVVAVRRDIRKVADVPVPVLVRGASGTGKELVARAIHDASARRAGPYVPVNLGAVPPTLAAAELFGAVRGAFTGASHDRQGAFARAQGGTLFLDEIGEAPAELQVMLLRALETGEILPVGSDRPRSVDVRVVAATDAALESAIAAERFRAPLYYRLAGYVIQLPALRERREDLGRLLATLLRGELARVGDPAALEGGGEPWLPAAQVARLAMASWPGNVRQLGNVARQLAIGNRGLRPAAHFEAVAALGAPAPARAGASEAAPAAERDVGVGAPSRKPEPEARAAEPLGTAGAPPLRPADVTEAQLVAALRAHRFSPERAAAALGIPRASLYRLMERSPLVRKASALSAREIEEARAQTSGSDEAVAERLEVSVRALRRRIGELGLGQP